VATDFLAFSEIASEFLREYEKNLQKVKKNGVNTIYGNMKFIARVLTEPTTKVL